LARSSPLATYRFLFTLVAACTVALFAAAACAQPPGGQGGPGGGPNNGGPGGGPGNGEGWGNQSGNWNNGGNNRNGRDRRGRRNGFFPQQQFSANYFTRPYPYHLDYYRMRWGGSYAPYYGNLYGPSNSFYPSQYNGDYGPNYNGQNDAGQNNPGPNDVGADPNAGPPPTMGDPSYSNNGGGEWRWCWIPYSGSPYYGAAPPTFESVGPTYERGPIYHGPYQVFYPGPGDAAPVNELPDNPPGQPNSTGNSQQAGSQSTGNNSGAPTLTPAR
jgi:hypothetical protein